MLIRPLGGQKSCDGPPNAKKNIKTFFPSGHWNGNFLFLKMIESFIRTIFHY